MRRLLMAAILAALPMAGWSKLPAPTPEAQAKADQAKAKATEAAKQEAVLLERYQERAVANWAANAKAHGVPFNPSPVAGPQVALPASGTVVTADKTIPTPAQAAATSGRANAQPAQAGGLPRDAAGGAGSPVVRP